MLTQNNSKTPKLFYSYSHKDKRWLKKLTKHLSPLCRENLIDDWYDGKIKLGKKWAKSIEDAIKEADIILLLISSDFLASDFLL